LGELCYCFKNRLDKIPSFAAKYWRSKCTNFDVVLKKWKSGVETKSGVIPALHELGGHWATTYINKTR